jgi:hypothetical protein
LPSGDSEARVELHASKVFAVDTAIPKALEAGRTSAAAPNAVANKLVKIGKLTFYGTT